MINDLLFSVGVKSIIRIIQDDEYLEKTKNQYPTISTTKRRIFTRKDKGLNKIPEVCFAVFLLNSFIFRASSSKLQTRRLRSYIISDI